MSRLQLSRDSGGLGESILSLGHGAEGNRHPSSTLLTLALAQGFGIQTRLSALKIPTAELECTTIPKWTVAVAVVANSAAVASTVSSAAEAAASTTVTGAHPATPCVSTLVVAVKR